MANVRPNECVRFNASVVHTIDGGDQAGIKAVLILDGRDRAVHGWLSWKKHCSFGEIQ